MGTMTPVLSGVESKPFRPAKESHALPHVAVIIPAHNEEASIALVLGDLPLVGRVIVVDNDSTDRTAAVARECRAIVAFEKRRGYQALTFFLDVGPWG